MAGTLQLEAAQADGDEEEEEEVRREGDARHSTSKLKSKARTWLEQLFPRLTLFGGRETLSHKRSTVVVALLYFSHSFSAWGDRMWDFSVFLFLALLYPGSLLLPGVYGFAVQLVVAVFGTVVGDWVDLNPRMKVVWISLLVQNGLVALCAVALALMFAQEWNVCQHLVVFSCLTVVIVILGAGAHLATVANTIAIERDWVVVLSDGNKDTLACLNANMRRIDLLCKLLAPAITGVFLQHTGAFVTTIIVAGWNVASFFLELSLVWLVYRMVPPLAVKKKRKPSLAFAKEEEEEEEEEVGDTENGEDIEELDKEERDKEEKRVEKEEIESGEAVVGDELHLHRLPSKRRRRTVCFKFCRRLLNPVITLKDGWKIFIRQEVMLVGLSMATIYLTVLGFSGVTSTYLLSQGLRGDLIGLFQGVGAVIGVAGTVAYPFIRKKVGTTRTGLFGISAQIVLLLFCAVGAVVPSRRISSVSSGYYSADCSGYNTSNSSLSEAWGSEEEAGNYSSVVMSCVLPTAHGTLTLSGTWPSASIQPSPTLRLESSKNLTVEVVSSNSHKSLVSTVTVQPSPPALSCSPLPTVTPSPPSQLPHGISVSLVLILIGVLGARFGLWMFDLAVSQLVQERVIEEERGVVSGVMNAMNSIMDMLHYVLVIVAPRPEHFRILTLLSVAMVMLGWLFYALFVRKTRGHFFHFRKCVEVCRERRRVGRGEGGGEVQTSLVNKNSSVEEEEEEES